MTALDGETFTDISDIDIAVEGLGAAERYFALLAKFEHIRGHLPAELAAFRAAVQDAARAGD